MRKIQRGQFYNINTKEVGGHKGRIVSVKKNKVKAVVVTHSDYVKQNKGSDKKTLLLKNNPNPLDKKPSYVHRKPKYAKIKNVGKHHPEMKVKNKHDKSLFRKIGRKK